MLQQIIMAFFSHGYQCSATIGTYILILNTSKYTSKSQFPSLIAQSCKKPRTLSLQPVQGLVLGLPDLWKTTISGTLANWSHEMSFAKFPTYFLVTNWEGKPVS
ncbi:hypothetical protein FEM48_Zijuj12G0100200 [Ziziphus jujuba var. spinosa]|uniref:Uncharacterized protein n=1 Tax=Ziziphus jujuba var. spinosa TaxID=714518 RepID=A0A978UCN6_ZIZJJ|nr:hypothetical protein FEM48_Zijuj12G0100200 [Ziziphus jujuba var. spinosa]